MKLKLFVLTHKDGFGSMTYFSEAMTKEDKQVMESIPYKKYKAVEDEIREVIIGKSFVYFISYVGGLDEFGREYRTVISAKFEERLNIPDGEELRKIFHEIQQSMENENENQRLDLNSYNLKLTKKKTIKNIFSDPKARKIKIIKASVGILTAVGLFFAYTGLIYFLSSKTFMKDFERAKMYYKLRRNIDKEEDNFKKYSLAYDFLENERGEFKKYLKKSEEKEYKNISISCLNNPNDFDGNLNKIDLFLKYFEESDYEKELLDLKLKIQESKSEYYFKDLKNFIIDFNVNLDEKTLDEIIQKSKFYIENIKGKYTDIVNTVLKHSEELKYGKNKYIKVYVTDKNDDLNGYLMEFELSDSVKRTKRTLSNASRIYIGNIKTVIKIGEKIEGVMYIKKTTGERYSFSNFSIPLNGINKEYEYRDKNNNLLKIKLEIDMSDIVFKI